MMLLEFKDLTVRFGNVTAVDRVNFSVKKGSFTSLVGESGSGKTVTALSVCRLLRADHVSGAINWYGQNPHRDLLHIADQELRTIRGRQIAYVFQDPGSALNPVMKVGEQIVEAAGKDAAKTKALELLRGLSVEDPLRFFDSYPHELSGGMRQRAMLAAALIGGARMLIADEPTTALDPTIQDEILELLARLRRERGLTVLFITHDLGLARAFSDATLVMEKGRVVASDSAYARRLMNATLKDARPKTFIEV